MLLDKCFKIILSNEEYDCECYKVGYQLSYNDGKILFKRITEVPNYESEKWGYTSTKAHERVVFEQEATVEEYANLPIYFIKYFHEYREEFNRAVDCIDFKPIFN